METNSQVNECRNKQTGFYFHYIYYFQCDKEKYALNK